MTMKKILYIAVMMAFAACSGTIDPEQGKTDKPGEGDIPVEQIPDEFTEPFTLSADIVEVEADGLTEVTFSLKDKYDREMLEDKKTLQNINITSDKHVRVPRMGRTATFIENGTYTFTATYLGAPSGNTVQVKAVNRAKYEVFHRNIGLFKATSVWCSACPALAQNLHGISDNAKEHTVVLACHGDFNYADPFSIYVGQTSLGAYILSYFGSSGWPTLVYDLETAEAGSSGTSTLENNIYSRRVEAPATCGIKVSSVKVEGTVLKVKASVKTSTGGDYDLACAVLRDGLEYAGGYSADDSGIYDEVVLTLTPNFLRYSSESGRSLQKDEEFEAEFSFDFGEGNVPSEAALEDYYVAVWAHRKTSDSSVMDNIVKCSYGKTADYRYNE